MQRILSFQTARGFEETSEFVTKRMCISFLFSIGFLCFICGFFVGRFAAETAVDKLAEKKRIELSGNGLENVEFLKQILIEKLQHNNYSVDRSLFVEWQNGSETNIEKSLSRLEYFNKLTFEMGCLIGTVLGRREPDRYVILHAAESSTIAVTIQIIREFNNLNIRFQWAPQRSLVFMLCKERSIKDLNYILSYRKENIVALISLETIPLHSNRRYDISGSDMIKSVVFEALMENKHVLNADLGTKLRRLNIDVPHARIQFTISSSENVTIVNKYKGDIIRSDRRALAQTAATSIWQLSQITLFRWYPQSLEAAFHKALVDLNSSIPAPLQGIIDDKVKIITEYGNRLNDKINTIIPFKSLDARMMNDFIINFEIDLLCPNENHISQTDFALLYELSRNQTNLPKLDCIVRCFERVIQRVKINHTA